MTLFRTLPQMPINQTPIHLRLAITLLLVIVLPSSSISGEKVTAPYLHKFQGRLSSDSILSYNFIPIHYDVELWLKKTAFLVPKHVAQGQVKITGKFVQSRRGLPQLGTNSTSPSINLSIRNIYVDEDSITIQGKTLKNLTIQDVEESDGKNKLILQLDREASLEEELELTMSFKILENSEKLRSFQMKLQSGEERTYFWTKPNTVPVSGQRITDHLFPSVDDSARLRTTFQLTIFRKESCVVVSNTERISSQVDPDNPGWVQDKFERTPPMTLENVALWSSDDFEYIRTASSKNRIGIYMPNSTSEINGRGDFMAEVVMKIVNFYEDFFEVDSGAKIDIVWHPMSVSMATPGLIPISEMGPFENLFFEERQKQTLIGELIGPLLMQWFLPYTTSLSTYSQLGKDQLSLQFLYIYLKELGISSLTPPGNLWEGTLDLRKWCQQEYSMNTETIGDNKYDARDFLCEEMFSGESKHANSFPFLGMIADENLAGSKTIQEAIILFRSKLVANSEQNIATDKASRHLFMEVLREITNPSHVFPPHASPDHILSAWETQFNNARDMNGLQPYITVIVDVVNDTHLGLSLERNDDMNWEWLVPVTVQNENGVVMRFWLEYGFDPVVRPVDHVNSKWIMINFQTNVIHRTIYHPILLQKLRSQLESDHTVFPTLARCRLLTDYIYLLNEKHLFGGHGDLLTVPNVLGLTQYLEKETELIVWVSVIQRLQKLGYIGSRSDHAIIYPAWEEYQNLNDYLIPKLDLAMRTLSPKNFGKHPSPILNLELQFLKQACDIGHTFCRKHTRTLLKQWKETPSLFQPSENFKFEVNLLSILVLGRGARGYQFVFDKLLTKDGEPMCEVGTLRKWIATQVLSHTRDEGRLKSLLDMLVSNSTLTCRKGLTPVKYHLFQEASYIMTRSLLGNEVYRRFFFEYCSGDQSGGVILKMDHLPKSYSRSQLDMITSFLDGSRAPTCLPKYSYPPKEISAVKTKLQNNFNAWENWMGETGTEIFNWFGDNAGCTVDYCRKQTKSPGINKFA